MLGEVRNITIATRRETIYFEDLFRKIGDASWRLRVFGQNWRSRRVTFFFKFLASASEWPAAAAYFFFLRWFFFYIFIFLIFFLFLLSFWSVDKINTDARARRWNGKPPPNKKYILNGPTALFYCSFLLLRIFFSGRSIFFVVAPSSIRLSRFFFFAWFFFFFFFEE